MKFTYQNINPATSRFVTPPLNTQGLTQLDLSFKTNVNHYGAGYTLKFNHLVMESTGQTKHGQFLHLQPFLPQILIQLLQTILETLLMLHLQ
jgi:hypothetical protein